MKQKLRLFSILALIMITFTACRELVERTHINDYVTITDAVYHRGYTTTMLMGNVMYVDTVDPEYNIEYKYNGTEEYVDDELIYTKYKDKIGEKVPAVIRVDTYDDGTVKYTIESVDWDIDEDKD